MILITGGAGYIGSHCVIGFLNAGKKIIVVDNLENGHIETINKLKQVGDINFVKCDLRNIEEIEKVFAEFEIDTVIHFAGFIQVEESVKNPSVYYRNNVTGTLNLLDTMVKYGVKNIVFSSTCAIYGEPEYTPLDEKHVKNPVNPYGRTKLIIEQILDDYDSAYGIKSIKLRYFNVAGADTALRMGEWHEPETHLIPNILKSVFKSSESFKVYGTDYPTKDGTCIRDYVNVEDMAEAHILAYNYLKKKQISDCFNIGTEQGYSVNEVFNTVKKITGREINVEYMPRRDGDAAVLYADASKACEILGWKPRKTLEESIKTAYLWEQTKHNN